MSALSSLDGPDIAALERLMPRANWSAALLELGGIVGLIRATDEQLREHLSVRAVTSLRASLEVAQRFHLAREQRPRMHMPQAVYDHLRPSLEHLSVEHFVVLYLNARSVLLRQATVAVGSVDQCNVDPRAVFAPAVMSRASAVIVAHNHPSGDSEPSAADIALTAQLVAAGRTLCVKVLDHIIVGHHGFCSLQSRGLMPGPDGP